MIQVSKEITVTHIRGLELSKLEEIVGQNRCDIVQCGNFNAYITLWGSDRAGDRGNIWIGKIVCLCSGCNVRIKEEYTPGFTLVSNDIAELWCWKVYEKE